MGVTGHSFAYHPGLSYTEFWRTSLLPTLGALPVACYLLAMMDCYSLDLTDKLFLPYAAFDHGVLTILTKVCEFTSRVLVMVLL